MPIARENMKYRIFSRNVTFVSKDRVESPPNLLCWQMISSRFLHNQHFVIHSESHRIRENDRYILYVQNLKSRLWQTSFNHVERFVVVYLNEIKSFCQFCEREKALCTEKVLHVQTEPKIEEQTVTERRDQRSDLRSWCISALPTTVCPCPGSTTDSGSASLKPSRRVRIENKWLHYPVVPVRSPLGDKKK